MNEHSETRDLPCVLTEAEVRQKSDRVAQLLGEYEQLEEEKKEAASSAAERLKSIRVEVMSRGKEIRERQENRLVECRWLYNRVKRQMELVRQDTGGVVAARDPRPDEIQGRLWDDFQEGRGDGADDGEGEVEDKTA